MRLFEVEPALPVSERVMENLEETFTQKPIRLKLPIPQITERIIIEREERNWVPIVAIVSLLSFFGLLAFLAFTRRKPPERVRGEKPWP